MRQISELRQRSDSTVLYRVQSDVGLTESVELRYGGGALHTLVNAAHGAGSERDGELCCGCGSWEQKPYFQVPSDGEGA